MLHSSRKRYALTDSPFYRLRSKRRLAQILLASPVGLQRILRRQQNYTARWKSKIEDEKWLSSPPPSEEAPNYRLIEIPMPDLKAVQSRIANLLSRVAPPDYLFSPVKGRSYVDNASRHLGAVEFQLLDVADYFPSCSANKVAWFFHTQMQCSPDVTAILVSLVTHDQHLPQGSPCSPALAFFTNADMWEEIDRAVAETGCSLSVYADDITISGKYVPGALVWKIKQIIHSHGFKVKKAKEVRLRNSPADITGVIVRGSTRRLPNRQLKKLQDLKRAKLAATDPVVKSLIDSKIAGRLAQRRQVERL